MAKSSGRKEKLKQLIENLSDDKVEALTDQLVNSIEGEHPGTYRLFGDTDPHDIELSKVINKPGGLGGSPPPEAFDRDDFVSPKLWAEKVVEVARAIGAEVPSKVFYKGQVYDVNITPATPSPRKGIPGTPETIEAEKNIF